MSAPSEPPAPDLVTLEEAARRLGVSRALVRRRVDQANLVRVVGTVGRSYVLWRDVAALFPHAALPGRPVRVRSGPSQEALDQFDRLLRTWR